VHVKGDNEIDMMRATAPSPLNTTHTDATCTRTLCMLWTPSVHTIHYTHHSTHCTHTLHTKYTQYTQYTQYTHSIPTLCTQTLCTATMHTSYRPCPL
jgi:hypothetical protein